MDLYRPVVLVMLFTLICGPSLAGSAGLSRFAEGTTHSAGAAVRYMDDRDYHGGDVDRVSVESEQYYARLGFRTGDAKRDELFVKLGAADLSTTAILDVPGWPKAELDGDFGPLVGVGYSDATEFGGGWVNGRVVQAAWLRSDVDEVKHNGESARDVGGRVNAFEVDMTSTLGYSFADGLLTPYLGVRLSYALLDLDADYMFSGRRYEVGHTSRADHYFGVVGGLCVSSPDNRLSVGIEAEAGDERALELSVHARF